MRRAYRRPVTPAEVDAKYKLVAMARKEGDRLKRACGSLLQAILVSPDFLFRIERDPKAAARRRCHPVNDHEFASRLSYFLWASMPDEELSRLADRDSCASRMCWRQQVRRMMADPKAQTWWTTSPRSGCNFAIWAAPSPIRSASPPSTMNCSTPCAKKPACSSTAVIKEDRSVLDFIDAPFTFVNGILARHYGIAGVSGEEFQRVTLDGEKRGGLLTQGAILTVSSYPTRTSPPVRGKWVLENLLGAAPPPPPPNVPVLNEANLGKTVSMRERMEQHRKDPCCALCHNQMDPIGFGLESYDAVGAWRDKDGDFPIDTSGVAAGRQDRFRERRI